MKENDKSIVNDEYEAIVYAWRNIDNNMMYPGYHETKNENDGYINSSKNKDLIYAYSHGRMERHILWKGTKTQCASLENWMLMESKSNYNWKLFYNESIGGVKGTKSDFSVLTDEMKSICVNFINGKDPEKKKLDVYQMFDIETVMEISKAIENARTDGNETKNEYKIIKTSIGTLYGMDRNQVRQNKINPKKVDEIKDYMVSKPKEARKLIAPVIVLVYVDENGKIKREIIDGNHTTDAAYAANWSEVDVIYINFSDFNFSRANVNALGNQQNHDPLIKDGNSSSDCQYSIIKHYELLHNEDETVDMEGKKFRDTVHKYLSLWWSNKQIASNLKRAIIAVKTREAQATRNFKVYSESELDKITQKYIDEDPDREVVRISSEKCFNAGFGGVSWKMGVHERLNGLIIIKHNNITHYDKWAAAEEKLQAAIDWVCRKEINIKFIVLDSFEK